MKMLVHRDENPDFVVELDVLKTHIRVDHAEDDLLIHQMCAAAVAEIEQYAQIAILTQTIRVTIFDPVRESGLALPIGPVADGTTPVVTIDGEPFTGFDFVAGHRPYIRWGENYHTLQRHRLAIEYEAGFGPSSASVPRDLRQAIMDQTALHYDARSPMDPRSLKTSPHMIRIAARYRGVQM